MTPGALAHRGLAATVLAEFRPERAEPINALTYCDMTTSPDGRPLSVEKRLAEIRTRCAMTGPSG